MKRKSVWLVSFIVLLDAIGISIVYPIFTPLFIDPSYGLFSHALSLETRQILLGITLAIYPLCMFFGMSIIGGYADRWGRKIALICCLVGGIIGYIITAIGIVSLNFGIILVGRIITGLTAASEPIAQAVIQDISSAEDKLQNLNILAFSSSFGFIIGPLLAIILDEQLLYSGFGTHIPFIAVAILSILGLIVLCHYFTDTYQKPSHQIQAKKFSRRQIKQLLKLPNVIHLIFIYFLFISGWNFYFQFLSVYLIEEYGFSKNSIGLFLFFTSLSAASCCLLVVRPLLKRLEVHLALIIALSLMGCCFAVILLTQTTWVIWACILPLTLGLELAYITTIALFSDQGNADHKGQILGMLGSVKSAAWVIAPLFSGVIASISIKGPFMMGIICIVLAICVTLSYTNPARLAHEV